ncbi:MAG: hypothetical protein H0V49_01485 [Nocardioidaceae bacterium]|nr:hypothetical protein [Nocardioidaceae bacterium]
MRERNPGTGLVAPAAAALGICCGIPLLATLGALGFLAGLSMTSWMLVVLGAVAAVVGGWGVFGRGRRAGVDSSTCQPGSTHQ